MSLTLPLQLINSPEWAENPYEAGINYAISIGHPRFPNWGLSILTFFAIMRVGFIFGCLGIMIIPLFKGSNSRSKHFHLFRRVYPENGNSMPYLVPNRCMIIVACELLTSVLYLASSCFNYLCYSGDTTRGEPRRLLMMWVVIAWLPSYVGLVMAAWGLCYACLCDVGGTKNKKYSRILTPIVYNSIWISWSLLAIGVISHRAFRSVQVLTELDRGWYQLVALLKTASESWTAHHNIGLIPVRTLLIDMSSLYEKWHIAGSTVVGFANTWIALGSVLALFYVFVVCVLLHMLKQVLRMREVDSMTVNAQWSSTVLRELQAELQFLSRSSFVIVLSICAQIGEATCHIFVSEHMDSLYWRFASTIVCQIPGIFMVPALLLQSWRIFTERSTDESEFSRVPMNSVNKGIPNLTSQLGLGYYRVLE